MKRFLLCLVLLLCTIGTVCLAGDKREKREKKERVKKTELTLQQICEQWRAPVCTGDENIDAFLLGTHTLVLSYKVISEEVDFIKIVTNEIEDAGDGVTAEVLITDGDGNERCPEATAARWVELSVSTAVLGVSAATVVLSGVKIVQGIVQDPSKALFMLGAIRQLSYCVKALNIMVRDIPITVARIEEQVKLMKQVKAN